MREAFRLCDTDEDCSMMALFDQDGDDKLNYQEFSDMMEQLWKYFVIYWTILKGNKILESCFIYFLYGFDLPFQLDSIFQLG